MAVRNKVLSGVAAAALGVSLAAVGMFGGGVPSASGEANGVGRTPVLGWSSWSSIRKDPTAAKIEATADAMVSSGLAGVGYKYVNVDDFWDVCPGGQGPDVDGYGRWATDATKFPPGPNGENGMQVVADYVHSKGLKFGVYVTPGISKQAVAQNTPIQGTAYRADDIATATPENNYNCGGMVGIDYSKPGAQAFINSWADEFASWGADYLKIDGVGAPDIPDVKAWSSALQHTGRPIHLELSNSLDINNAAVWQKYSNGWRTGGDIECYCGANGSSFPLTNWNNISRFDAVADWAPYGGPGGFNDYDSVEVGNGSNDGLTFDERKTQLSLWALASAPLILGTDLTQLDPTDLSLLKNKDVLAVDQDSIDAVRTTATATTQIFNKKEPNGDVIVGLFNTGSSPHTLTASASSLGLSGAGVYYAKDLWSGRSTETAGQLSATVPTHGVALYRIAAGTNPTSAPPNTSLTVSGLDHLTPGQSATATVTFTDNGVLPAQHVALRLRAPASWTVTPRSAVMVGTVRSGRTVKATFHVVAPTPSQLFVTDTVTAAASYVWHGTRQQHTSVTTDVVTSPPVQAPYKTYSSATDAPASFGQSGTQLGISGAGADLYTGADAYSTIYLPSAVATTATIATTVTSQLNLTGFGKAGIIVRNDMTGSGTTPEGVTLFESPAGGIQLEWNDNGGTYIDSVTPSNNAIPATVPVHLLLQRTSTDTYTGYYSLDPAHGWTTVGTATVPAQAATQDAGVFLTSHSGGNPAQATYGGLRVTASATPPPLGPTSYEAESPANTVAGGAVISDCAACSGGKAVGFLGHGGTLTVNHVTVPASGTYKVVVAYLDGSTATGTPGRSLAISVNGGPATQVQDTSTGGFSTVGTMTVPLTLTAGTNTIEFSNPDDYGPDVDRILVPSGPR